MSSKKIIKFPKIQFQGLACAFLILLNTGFQAAMANSQICTSLFEVDSGLTKEDTPLQKLIKRGAVVVDLSPEIASSLKLLVKEYMKLHLKEYLKRDSAKINFSIRIENGEPQFSFMNVESKQIGVVTWQSISTDASYEDKGYTSFDRKLIPDDKLIQKITQLIRASSKDLMDSGNNNRMIIPILSEFTLRFIKSDRGYGDDLYAHPHLDGGELIQSFSLFGRGTSFLSDSRGFDLRQDARYNYSQYKEKAQFVDQGKTLFLSGEESTISNVYGYHGIPFTSGKLRVLIIAHYFFHSE